MKRGTQFIKIISCFVLSLLLTQAVRVSACSTFMLHKGDQLVFGHNLNEGDMGVPGLLFINKRGVFKTGRSLNELMFKEVTKPSNLTWISRYGSITFNNFGKDLPDGGMNEAGFYIWEMNEEADYPKGDSLHKLSQMGWMQYLLDNCSTLDEALEMTKSIEIDGWGWHYFMADASGDCASLAFVDGKMKINRDKKMPVKGLFNTPYDREMEVAKYFKNFGGQYEVEIDNPRIPRFVKTDWLIKNYDPSQNVVDYGFYMLDKIKVDDEAEWSIIFDAVAHKVHFRTRINPAIKELSMKDIDFSAQAGPSLIQNMDIEKGGNVLGLMHPYTAKEMSDFLIYLGEIAGQGFFSMGGLTIEECVHNMTNHSLRAAEPGSQFFKGRWETHPNDPENKDALILNLTTNDDAVSGEVMNSKGDHYSLDNLSMINKDLRATFKTKSGTVIEIQARIDGNTMTLDQYGTEDYYGTLSLTRQE